MNHRSMYDLWLMLLRLLSPKRLYWSIQIVFLKVMDFYEESFDQAKQQKSLQCFLVVFQENEFCTIVSLFAVFVRRLGYHEKCCLFVQGFMQTLSQQQLKLDSLGLCLLMISLLDSVVNFVIRLQCSNTQTNLLQEFLTFQETLLLGICTNEWAFFMKQD